MDARRSSHRARSALSLLVVAALALAVCGSSSAGGPARAGGDPTVDKLAQILARGTLVLSTDPVYAPQSWQVKGAKRLAGTKCAETR